MQPRAIVHAALGVALGLTALGGTARSAVQPAPPPPTAPSPAQPAGGACPAGGKYVADDFSPKPAFPQQTRAPRRPGVGGYKVETVVSDVAYGRSMAFMPDGRMLLAERGGRLRIVGRDGRPGAPIVGIPPIAEPSALIGVMDIVLDLDFADSRLIYIGFTTIAPGQPKPAASFGAPPEGIGHIAKARLSAAGDRLEGFSVIFDGSKVRRLVAPGDGTLYFTTSGGDARTQAFDQDVGKVMRIRTDGAAPADNPWADRKDIGRFAYDRGHRDPDGLARDAQGRIWTIEHGPRGGDELNLIRPGLNYGFPVVSYGRQYSGALLNDGLTAMEGMQQPVYFWTPSVAPSSLMFYSGKMFPQWKGDAFLGSLVAESLIHLTLADDKVTGEAFLLSERCARIRDVQEAPDGSIYVLTDDAAGKVLRLTKD